MLKSNYQRLPLIRASLWLAARRLVSRAAGTATIIITVAPLAVWMSAEAQQDARVYHIGFLRAFACTDQLLFAALRQGLREYGYIESRNLAIECRALPEEARGADELAAELVRLKVDVLVTEGTRATLAAKQATTAIPIVMVYIADPVAAGIVHSLARPGGNITGVSANLTDIVWKNLEILKQVVPGISRVALLMDSTNPGQRLPAEQLDVAARAVGVHIQRIDVLSPAALDGALGAALRQRAEALIVYPILAIGAGDVRRISEFAIKNRLPTMTFHSPYLEAGLLMLYGANIPDQYRRASSYIDKILKGTKPADLPVEEPITYELIINQRTVRALRLKIPEPLLQRADRIIN